MKADDGHLIEAAIEETAFDLLDGEGDQTHGVGVLGRGVAGHIEDSSELAIGIKDWAGGTVEDAVRLEEVLGAVHLNGAALGKGGADGVSADGRRQISAFYFAGEIFGLEADEQRHFYAESVDSAGIRVLRPSQGDKFNESMFQVALKSLTRAQEHLMVLGRQNGTEKVAAFLLDIADRQASDRYVELSMQRCDIADYLGLSFETVSRILTKLRCSGTIRIPHIKQIELVDLEELEYLRG